MSSSLDQNIHLLLPKTALQSLRRRAKTEQTSVAQLIRQAIQTVYGTPSADRKKAAFDQLLQHSELVMDDWAKVKKDLLKRYE